MHRKEKHRHCTMGGANESELVSPIYNPSRNLRSSSTPLLQISLLKGTFQDSVANLYNDLPASISSITDDHNFVKESAKILKAKAIMRLAGLISMSGNFIILIFMILYLSVNNM